MIFPYRNSEVHKYSKEAVGTVTGALQVSSAELHIHNNFACATVSNLCSPLCDCNISANTNSVGVFKLTFLADLVTDRHLAPTPLC